MDASYGRCSVAPGLEAVKQRLEIALEIRRVLRRCLFVYADRTGRIGYQAPGVIPVRRLGEGRWPVPGWDAFALPLVLYVVLCAVHLVA